VISCVRIAISQQAVGYRLKLHDYAPVMSQRAAILGTYAMCGFANFSSVGIQLGGIAPERRSDLARIALRALVAGAFASWCTCCMAGIII